jgi:hypothetical protein
MRAAFCQQRGLALGTLDKYRRRVHKGPQSGCGPLIPVEVVWSTAQDANSDAGRDSVLVVEREAGVGSKCAVDLMRERWSAC